MKSFARVGWVAALAVLVVVVYQSTFRVVALQVSHDGYQHGYLVPLISAFLLWRSRDHLAEVPWRGSWLGVAVLAVSVWTWIVARTVAVGGVEQLAAVAMIWGLVLAVGGQAFFRRAWFPLLYLIFALPFGSSAIRPLMEITADLATAGLRVAGIPAYREGMLLWLPGGTFEVAEACSGLNYLNAGIALGVLVAHLMFKAVWRQVLYVAGAAAVFVLANGLRALIVMIIGSATHLGKMVGVDHIVFGWVLFLVTLLAMTWLARRYSDRHEDGA